MERFFQMSFHIVGKRLQHCGNFYKVVLVNGSSGAFTVIQEIQRGRIALSLVALLSTHRHCCLSLVHCYCSMALENYRCYHWIWFRAAVITSTCRVFWCDGNSLQGRHIVFLFIMFFRLLSFVFISKYIKMHEMNKNTQFVYDFFLIQYRKVAENIKSIICFNIICSWQSQFKINLKVKVSYLIMSLS